jgi:3-oxoacyl-[acyl-carrier protein] reductase
MSLRGQTALVTGATGGIGKAVCAALAEQKCHLYIHYHADEHGAKGLADSLKGFGVQTRTVRADLSDYKQVHTPKLC